MMSTNANIQIALQELPLSGPIGTSAESADDGFDPRITDLGATSQLIVSSQIVPPEERNTEKMIEKIVAAIGRARGSTRAKGMQFIKHEVARESNRELFGDLSPNRGNGGYRIRGAPGGRAQARNAQVMNPGYKYIPAIGSRPPFGSPQGMPTNPVWNRFRNRLATKPAPKPAPKPARDMPKGSDLTPEQLKYYQKIAAGNLPDVQGRFRPGGHRFSLSQDEAADA